MIINYRALFLVSAILAAAALRLIPHPANFTPIGALALFSGAYLGRRVLGFVAPFVALLVSDLALGFYQGMATVYFSTALVTVLGMATLQHRSAFRVTGVSIASSVLFFIVTNLGMWWSSGLYPQTLSGLEACFVAAIPFFQNSLAGDLFYTALLFGGSALAERASPALRVEAASGLTG